MEDNIAIKVEHVSKVYKLFDKPIDRVKESLNPFGKRYSKDFYALNDVSFEIKKGETIGIIGKNGAGKSTLLKMITGVLTPSSGTIQVNGRIASLLELGAGFSPEMTGIENIYMNGSIMGYSKEDMDDRLGRIIAFADIGDFINQSVKMYSSGMFARLAFAVNAFVEPDILIVDEALSVGDLQFQIKCMEKMKQMMDSGVTILFVSHDVNAIRRFCARVIWLNDGELQSIGDKNKVSDQYIDYLKCGDLEDVFEKKEEEILGKKLLKPFAKGDNIAEIIDFKILNQDGFIVNEFELDVPLTIEVTYDVYDENISNPVLGIAIMGLDADYVCGLNTLLDGVDISWKYGRNRFKLKYPYGIRAVGGKYCFDVALMEKTATVPIHYIANVEEFTIISGYLGEGRYIIPHEWSVSYG